MNCRFPAMFAVILFGVGATTPSIAEDICLSPQDLPVLTLPGFGFGSKKIGTIHRILKIPRDSHCSLDQGSSAQAVLLELTEPPLQVSIASIGKPKKGLVPIKITVLDAERIALSQFRFSEFTQRGNRQSMQFHLDPASNPRYVLIETDLEQLGNSGSFVAGVGGRVVVAGPGFFGSFVHGSEKTMDFPYVETGEVDVEFRRFDDELTSH